MARALRRVYYDPKHPAGFSNPQKLYKFFKSKYKIDKITEWLKSQPSYTLHRRAIKKFRRRKIIASGIDSIWQADLMDVSNTASSNKGVKFLLTVIDVVSKFAFVRPLTGKDSAQVANAFKDIISGDRKPIKLNTDRGREFLGLKFQQVLRDNNIGFYTSQDEIKCAIVERFNRTMRERLARFMTHKGDTYINRLQDIVQAYNSSKHRSIGMAPKNVTKSNEDRVWTKLYGEHHPVKFEFEVGDTVRLARLKSVFEKGSTKRWTTTLYTVVERRATDPATYRVEDSDTSEPIIGWFYSRELQKAR